MVIDSSSLERLIPDKVQPGDVTGQEALVLHLARYEFAARHARPGRLLDIACGVGYGTRLLVEHSKVDITALGVDISEEAIAYARQRYGNDRVKFAVADATQFTSPDGFDTIVSIETIEHMPDPNAFIAHILQQLRPSGVFIGSVPTTPSADANPHHLHDFTERSFRKMIQCHGLKEIACFRQVQPYNIIPVITKREKRARDIRSNISIYYLSHPTKFALRLWATLRYGFTNHYITISWKAQD